MTKFKIVKALHTALALSLPLTFAAAPALFPTAVAAGTLPSPYVSRALDAVLLHHETPDGRGYPHGLPGAAHRIQARSHHAFRRRGGEGGRARRQAARLSSWP